MNSIDLYGAFIEYSYSDLKDKFYDAKNKEERDFYMVLANLVLQREQNKIINSMEELRKIKQNLEKTLNPIVLRKVVNINEAEYGEQQVIRVYVKDDIEVLEMADILINIEDFARKSNHNVVVDFFRSE